METDTVLTRETATAVEDMAVVTRAKKDYYVTLLICTQTLMLSNVISVQ